MNSFFKTRPALCHLIVTGALALSAVVQAAGADARWKFDFGPGKVEQGAKQVLPGMMYDKEAGFGFEPGAEVEAESRDGEDALRGDFCTSKKPFYFSVAVPEGNYLVTVTLGDAKGESTATIKSELRRLMVESMHTASGEVVSRSFAVNVRAPGISTGGEVHLKTREKTDEIWGWDEKLTLEFNGARPCVCGIEITALENAVTLYILGDSTVCDQPLEPWNSWGQMLPRFFNPGVAVANNAESGESLRSSLHARRLDKVISTMKAGDYLFIQYGHNDMKEKGEGIGAFTTYAAELEQFVAAARGHGGIPVLITSMHRKTLDANGKITNSLGDYPEAVRRVAREKQVPLIDLNEMSGVFYEALGPQNIGKAFQDGTHHNSYGGYELARCVVEGIRKNKLGLMKFLAEDAGAFDPAKPDLVEAFHIPPSPRSSGVKPLGN